MPYCIHAIRHPLALRCGRNIYFEMLDVVADPNRQPLPVGPAEGGSLGDGRVIVSRVVDRHSWFPPFSANLGLGRGNSHHCACPSSPGRSDTSAQMVFISTWSIKDEQSLQSRVGKFLLCLQVEPPLEIGNNLDIGDNRHL